MNSQQSTRPSPKDYIAFFTRTDHFGALLGAKFVSISDRECIYEYTPQSTHFNPNQMLHGGALFSVMDSSQGAFVHFQLNPDERRAATGTATIRFISPVKSGTITIRTWLEKIEGRKLFVSSVAMDEQKKEVARLEEIWVELRKKENGLVP